MSMRFGRYELLATLKQRGPFVTRRAKDADTGDQFILKMLPRDQIQRDYAEALQRELEMIRAVTSEHIVTAYDIVWEDDVPALVLSDHPGSLLATYLRQTTLGVAEALQLGILVARALEDVHAANLICGDLSPQNFIVSPTGDAVHLIDLGLAETGGLPSRSGNILRGAADYMAPEATGRLSRAADHRADLYSFGVILFEMLSGKHPFEAEDLRQKVYAHMALPPTPLSSLVPTAPETLVKLTDRLLAKQPEQRYQTTHGLLTDLEHCLALVQGAPAPANFELGAADIPNKLTISTTLQGRSAQMELIRRRYERIREGRSTILSIEIAGGAGVGKSTLVEGMRRFIEQSGGLFLIARIDAQDPIGGLMQAARNLSEMLLTERYGSVADWRFHFEDTLRDTMPVLAGLFPECAALIGETEAAPQLGPRESAERTSLALRRFFRACGTAKHPLALVVEDTHLADKSTVAFLSSLARAQGQERLLLVLTRRAAPDAKVPDLTTDDKITLGDLDVAAVSTLLAETFREPAVRLMPLAQAIMDKVGGAPLAIGQFLGVLVDDGTLAFDEAQRRWTWDEARVRAQSVGENVVELLLARGASLSEEERRTIGALSCIGERFDYNDAATALGPDAKAMGQGLERAVSMGWLLPEADTETDGAFAGLRFAHERIWNAATSMLDPETKRDVHARLAGTLLNNDTGLPQGDALYDAARHARMALPPDAAPEDAARVRGLCAAAGGQALGLSDLQRGYRYFGMAHDLLTDDDWASDPGAALELTAGTGAAAMLALAFDEADALFVTFLERCPDMIGRVGVQAMRNVNSVVLNNARGGLANGLAALAELGVDIPAEPGPADIGAAAAEVFEALGDRDVASLIDLPDATDPKAIAIQGLLAATSFPAYSANPLAFAVLAAKLVSNSIRNGVTEHSAAGFIDFALTACGPMNQVDKGYAFALLSLKMVETKQLTQFVARVHSVFEGFIRHRKEPIRQSLPGSLRWREEAVAVGDPIMAGLAAFVNGFNRYWIGERIEHAVTAFAEAELICSDLNIGLYPDIIAVHRQSLACLSGAEDDPWSLSGAFADADDLITTFQQRRDLNGLAHVHLAQMLLALTAGDRTRARDFGRACHGCLPGIISTAGLPHFYVLFALAVGVEAETDSIKPSDLAILEEGIALTKYWAEQAPDNYTHHHLILEAEMALAMKDAQKWRDNMEAAAEQATKAGFTRNAALVLERIALVSRARKRQRSYAHFIRDAWRAWIHYGAEAKVEAMAQSHLAELQSLIPVAHASDPETRSEAVQSEQLDLDALLDATRAISSEVRVPDLLSALLSGVVEIAGANSAMVVAPDGDGFRIMARMHIDDTGPQIISEQNPARAPFCTPEMAPLSAFRLVARLARPLSTSDVTSDARLSGDAFFASDVPLSLAVVPLTKGQDLVGLIYLENRDVSDAFRGLRMNLLNALCAQAAISWDNARLYDRQSRLLAAADRFVPGELARLFHRDSIVDVEMTDARFNRMTIMVSDLRGSTTSAEHLGPQQTFARVNRFLATFSEVAHTYRGVVLKYTGDGVLALFPSGSQDGINAAIEIQSRLDRDQTASNHSKGLAAGIAIHSGEIMFGVIGDGERMQIDALSDAVNVTFRLETLTKRFGSRVLISEEALADVRKTDTVMDRLRYLGEVETKGRVSRTVIYEVIDAEPEGLRDAKFATVDTFEDGVRMYNRADWVSACVSFSNVLRENPGDTAASGLFQEAARKMGQAGRA